MKVFSTIINGNGAEKPLPKSRKSSFAIYGRENFWLLVWYGAISALFALPTVVWLYVMNYSKAQFLTSLDPTAENYTIVLSYYLDSFNLTTYSIMIPLLALLFVGLSGCLFAVNRIVFGKSCKISTFFQGIKENGLRFLFFGGVFGVAVFLLNYNLTHFTMIQTSFINSILQVGACLLFALVCSIVLFCAAQTVVYRVTVAQMIKNAFLLTFARFFANLGILTVLALPILLTLFIPSPFQILALLILSLLYFGFASLLALCYANAVFDKYINPKLGEKFVGIGLSKAKGKENDAKVYLTTPDNQQYSEKSRQDKK